jgi:phenylacetate-coenzyme A ligase PaaK-like adenylate-forming protein
VIWNPQRETLPRDQFGALQLDGLRRTVDRLLTSVPPIAARLRSAGITAGREIESLEDLQRLPFTRRGDFQDHYPTGLFAVPLEQVVRFHASSGTHGRPKIVGYTSGDLSVWAEVVARCLGLAGVRPGMRVHNAYGYGLFTGGLGLHAGAELFGAPLVPASGGFTQRQATLLRDLGSVVLCCTPSYALTIAVERVLLATGGTAPHYQLTVERVGTLDQLTLHCEVADPSTGRDLLGARLQTALRETTGLTIAVDVRTGGSLPRSEGKASRVIDKRPH